MTDASRAQRPMSPRTARALASPPKPCVICGKPSVTTATMDGYPEPMCEVDATRAKELAKVRAKALAERQAKADRLANWAEEQVRKHG